MKKNITLIFLFLSISLSYSKDAKRTTSLASFTVPKNEKENSDNWPAKGSVYIGYGVHKIVARGDFKLSDKLIKVKNSSTRLYFDLGGDWQKFKQEDFEFSHVKYSSKVWMLSIGVGIGQEFIFYKDIFVIQPYFGLFYKYARFTDKDLVSAIGDNGIQRYTDYTYSTPIGKPVKNGYGNAFMIDFGSRIGFRIKKRFELGGSIGICPIKFSSANSLFGKYWAEKPYGNDYYIKRLLFKADVGIKINF